MLKSTDCSRGFKSPLIVALVFGVLGLSGSCLGAGGGANRPESVDKVNKQVLQATLLGAGVSLVAAGFIIDDREEQRLKYRDDLGNWEYETFYPAEERGWGDQKSLWVAGATCLGFALIVEVANKYSLRNDEAPQEETSSLSSSGLHLESTNLDGRATGLGLAADF